MQGSKKIITKNETSHQGGVLEEVKKKKRKERGRSPYQLADSGEINFRQTGRTNWSNQFLSLLSPQLIKHHLCGSPKDS